MSSLEIPNRSREAHQLPVELVSRILSLLRDAKSVVQCMAVSRKWLEAVKQIDCLFFNCFEYQDKLSGQEAEAMITKLVMTTTRLRSLSVFHDDRDKWLSETAAIAWIIHTKPTLRELFISNSRKDADDKHRHHPTLFRALNEQLRNSQLEKFALDYVVIPESVPSFSLPHLRSLRFYDVRMTGQSLTALMAGCTSLELLRLIDLRDCDFVDLHCPSLKEFVMEETGEVGSVHLDCPKLKRLLLRDVGGIKSLRILDGSKLRKVEIFTEFCEPAIDIRGAASVQHAHLLFKGNSWAQMMPFVGGTAELRELGVCIQNGSGAPVDLEDFVALCPGLRTLGIGPDLWERLSKGSTSGGSSRWNELSQLKIDTASLRLSGMTLLSSILDRCPSLKSVELAPRAPEDSWEEEVSLYATSLISTMQRHPTVKIEVDFDHSYTIIPF